MPHAVFDLFTFREQKFLYNWDKFPYDIIVGTTSRTNKKISVKFLEIIFKRNKQKHYPLIITGNLHILMKYSLIDICVKILFQKSNFPVTARDLIFFFENTLQLEAATRGVRNFIEMRLWHRCFPVKLAKVVSVCLVILWNWCFKS